MISWLRTNDFLNNSEMRTTHTLMSGGVVGVPDDRNDEFLELYAAEVKSKNKTLSFSECRSDPVFCMYFDIDLLDTCKTSPETSSQIFATIQAVIKSYYAGDRDDDRFRCVICDTDTKDVVREANGETRTLLKNGYHITFPNLRVTLTQALQLRYSVVYELEKSLGQRPGHLNAWSDVIDRAPYTSGLKMCGSFKRVKCTSCKKSDDTFKDRKKAMLASIVKVRKKIHPRPQGFVYSDLSDIHEDEFKDAVFGEMYGKYLEFTGFNSCRVCLNKGHVIENRTYLPYLVLDGGGDTDNFLLDAFREDYFKMMKYTSIRCHAGEPITVGYNIPRGVPKPPTEDNGANMRNFSSKRLMHLGSDMHSYTLNNDIYLHDAQTIQLWKGPRVEDEERLSVIRKFIRENIFNAYAGVHIRKVCETTLARQVRPKSSGGNKVMNSLVSAHSGTVPPSPAVVASKRYMVYVGGVGSTFCMNKGSEHESNTVYFIITKDTCYQRCFSKKPDVRIGGTTCSAYRSGGTKVPAWVSSVLFPCQDGKRAPTTSQRRKASTTGTTGKATKSNQKTKRSKIEWGAKKL